MIRGFTETGSIYIGLVPGRLLARLIAGEAVAIPLFVDARGVRHPAFTLDFSRGPESLARLIAGERVCCPPLVDMSGRLILPHICIFMRDDNASLIAATAELFPRGFTPGAHLEHIQCPEPDGSRQTIETEQSRGNQ